MPAKRGLGSPAAGRSGHCSNLGRSAGPALGQLADSQATLDHGSGIHRYSEIAESSSLISYPLQVAL